MIGVFGKLGVGFWFAGECAFCLRAEAGDVLPVVSAGMVGDEGWERHAEVVCKWVSVALVEGAHFSQACFDVAIAAEADAFGAEMVVEALECNVWEAVGHLGTGFEGEDLSKVDEGVTSHEEGELGLAGRFLLNAGDEQGACVEDGDEGAEPALIGVLGAEIAE